MNGRRAKILKAMCNAAAWEKIPPTHQGPGRVNMLEHRRRTLYARNLYKRVKRAHDRLPWKLKASPVQALIAARRPVAVPTPTE